MTINIQPNSPIILGLSGKAGSGKTSVAEQIVPKGSFANMVNGIVWDHIFYALPLYELASIRKTISGTNADSRQLFAIHSVLFDIYGGSPLGSIPSYQDFVERVSTIKSLQIEPEGIKPRSFLQKAGDICRQDYADCFAKWGVFKANRIYNQYIKSLSEDEEESTFGVIISDVRFENEAELILQQPNGFVVYFDADQEVLNQRILNRDGKIMTDEQKNHISEQQTEIVKSIATSVIDCSSMTIEQQTNATLGLIKSLEVSNA